MDFFVTATGAHPDFQGSILVLPQPSLGSVAQLASDLIVHASSSSSSSSSSPNWRVVGYLGLQERVPVVSGLDYLASDTEPTLSGGITFAVQVYQTLDNKVTLVLPRSPVVRARRQRYIDSLQRWILENNFTDTLIVSSVDAAMRMDDSIREPTPFRHLIVSNKTPLQARLSKIGPSYLKHPLTESGRLAHLPTFPHGGLTRKLFENLLDSSVTVADAGQPSSSMNKLDNVSGLIVYTSEGDNTILASQLADVLIKVLGLDGPPPVKEDENGVQVDATKIGRWTKPKSWLTGLSGKTLDRNLAGEMFG
ncbi:hypothetical protein OIV83_003239 [Microbotryomycetes sp. JL201]|nr:hypothetical protein OIV83_003239 [Microbotryomycetes sp. JL201]